MTDHFDLDVQRQVQRLVRHTCQTIEAEVARKRIAWCAQNYRPGDRPDRPSPRQAFELLFFDYLQLPENELRVVSETDTEIVWLSLNPCPTLTATQQLGLDTRQVCRAAYEKWQVCRAAYEKSTQAFLSQIDPRLRFLRSYAEIRPYTGYCREMIVRVDFEAMMSIAIEEARISRQAGHEGYGAVVAAGQRLLARAHAAGLNELHAEVVALREAARVLNDSNLSGAILFSTCEPCRECYSVAKQANVTSIVYGASNEESAQFEESKPQAQLIGNDDPASVMIEVIGNVLHDECRALFEREVQALS
jgi:tRNA(Arg) A34 adenosine deaminase TadA